MKKIEKMLSAFIILCQAALMLPCGAYAGDSTVLKRLSVNLDGCAGEECTLRVMKPGISVPKTADEIIYADECEIDENGNAAFSVVLKNADEKYKYIAVSSSGEKASGEISAYDNIYDNEAYYLADDDFTMLKANSSDELSDWGYDVTEKSGNIDYSSEGLTLHDDSLYSSTRVKRTFEEQTDVAVSAEMCLKFSGTADGSGFSIKNNNSDIVKFEISDSMLKVNGAAAESVQSDAEYGVRLDMNLLMQTVDVYINGYKRVTGAAINGSSVNSLEIFTSKSGTDSLDISCVRIMRGYYASDEFVPYRNGQNLPKNGFWDCDTSGGSVKIIKTVGTPTADYYSLCLSDTSKTGSAGISKNICADMKQAVFTFKLYSAETVNNLDIASGALSAKVDEGLLKIKNSLGEYESVGAVKDKIWNTIRLTIDFEKSVCTVQINGKETAYNKAFSGGESGKISFKTGSEQTDTIWLDDIYLYENIEHSDYPPMPQTKEKSDIIVGMQTCDLWRQGKHFGWDKINGYPSRKPYLGYYDDGSSEVADWEIKYMADHGIDYAIRCWYRPGWSGSPIKEPRNGYALHDGYFNAKYKDKIKFAIAWENGGWSISSENAAMSDFKENIVPFWIEYYFKDPNYFTMDNKIVLGIYDASKLTEHFGESGAKEAISYLTEQVKSIGFDGIYLLGQTGSSDSSVLQKYSDNGYDAVYCYSYGQRNVSLIKQKECIAAQKGCENIISSIPTVTMGRDDSAWNRTAGAFITPSALKELCSWVKDTYFTNNTGDRLGDRMIMLDNWNEYGEGHYFMPSGIGGFGYLEAVGQVFGQKSHKDIRPENTQRLGRLYDSKREFAPREQTLKMYGVLDENALLKYDTDTDFNSNCSTAGSSYYRTFKSTNGILQGTPSSWYTAAKKDPYFYTADNLNITLNGNEVLHFRYKKPAAYTNFTVYFSTNDEPNMSGSKMLSAKTGSSTDWIDVYLEAGSNANWKGTLKRLQIRPFGGEDSTDTFYFDVIEILRYKDEEFEPLDFSISFDGFFSGGEKLESVPQTAASAFVRYETSNPYDDNEYYLFIAEYDSDKMTGVSYSPVTAANGKNTIEAPVNLKSGFTYKTGLWDKNQRPMTNVGVIAP